MLRVSNYGSRLVPRNLVSRNPFLRPCTAAAQAALEDAGVQKKAAVAMVSTFPLRKDIQKLIETTKDNALAAERRDKEAALAAQRRDEAAVRRDTEAALATKEAALAAQRRDEAAVLREKDAALATKEAVRTDRYTTSQTV